MDTGLGYIKQDVMDDNIYVFENTDSYFQDKNNGMLVEVMKIKEETKNGDEPEEQKLELKDEAKAECLNSYNLNQNQDSGLQNISEPVKLRKFENDKSCYENFDDTQCFENAYAYSNSQDMANFPVHQKKMETGLGDIKQEVVVKKERLENNDNINVSENTDSYFQDKGNDMLVGVMEIKEETKDYEESEEQNLELKDETEPECLKNDPDFEDIKRSDSTELPHPCNLCDRHFKTLYDLQNHSLTPCTEHPHCNNTMRTLDSLQKHMVTHTSDTPHQCNLCDKQFLTLDYLKHHITTCNAPKTVESHQCHFCDKQFKTEYHLEQHMTKHYNDRPHICNVCERGFKTMHELAIHMACHSTELPHQCNVCDEGFSTTFELREHMTMHSAKRPYTCNVCEKGFKSIPQLGQHMTCHSTERPHMCNVCENGFKTTSDLRKHMLSHSSDRPHQCNVCGKAFKIKGHLTVHISRHSTERPHKCNVCEKGFKTRCCLRIHMNRHRTDKPHKCNVCEKGFKTKGEVRSHMSSHNHIPCVGNNPHLKVIRRSDSTERPHQCRLCHRHFKTLRDLKIHILSPCTKHPHKCNVCNNTFKTLDCLQKHMSSH